MEEDIDPGFPPQLLKFFLINVSPLNGYKSYFLLMVIIILSTAFMTKSTPAVFSVHIIPFPSFSTPFFGREKAPRDPLASGKQFST